MATIYTIGFTKKSLKEFINLLKKNKITKLIDTRLGKDSQLSGFAKSKDLKNKPRENSEVAQAYITEHAKFDLAASLVEKYSL